MNKEAAIQDIEREFATAARARSSGNEGMVRVCARRAAGIAIAWRFQTNGRTHGKSNAMDLLHTVRRDETLPAAIRDAAQRLTTRLTPQFASPFSSDPLEDGRLIIDYFLPPSTPSGG